MNFKDELVLATSCHIGQSIRIGDSILITIHRIDDDRVAIRVDAPSDVPVDIAEIIYLQAELLQLRLEP